MAKTQNKNFDINIEPLMSFKGDEKAIRQLVSILLDNAIKYSSKNGDIALSLKKQGSKICLKVSNTADEIRKETLPNLFERFYREDKSRNSETGGYGIGLSVAKAITSAHKGKISAETPDGKTMMMTVILPG